MFGYDKEIVMNDYIYNPNDAQSIAEYASHLVGKTFLDVIEYAEKDSEKLEERINFYGNMARKGGLGNLLEELYFGYKANSNQEADFEAAGVELKTTPYEYTKKGELRAGERLVITMIAYDRPFEKDFYKSHLWNKISLILLIYYWRNKKIENKLLYKIGYVKLFVPPAADLEIIKQDYEVIKNKVISGRAHELSESDTMYLGACTKGATAAKSTVPQYYNNKIPARKRAFCFKNSYMTFILNHYIVGHEVDSESIIKIDDLSNKMTFEMCIERQISRYFGSSDKELCEKFGRVYNNNKAQWVDLVYKMLGIKSNRAEEFEKANIVVKSIRIEEDGRMKESMSFPPFRFKSLVKEVYEESEVYQYFDETKFFFVVWKRDGDVYRVIDSQLWNMPRYDLEYTVRDGWENIRRIIKCGVQFNKKRTKRGVVITNNLPKKTDNLVIHVRPHAQKSAYKLNDGTIIGDVERDANELPNGEYMTTQSFWINNSYILKQLNCMK